MLHLSPTSVEGPFSCPYFPRLCFESHGDSQDFPSWDHTFSTEQRNETAEADNAAGIEFLPRKSVSQGADEICQVSTRLHSWGSTITEMKTNTLARPLWRWTCLKEMLVNQTKLQCFVFKVNQSESLRCFVEGNVSKFCSVRQNKGWYSFNFQSVSSSRLTEFAFLVAQTKFVCCSRRYRQR